VVADDNTGTNWHITEFFTRAFGVANHNSGAIHYSFGADFTREPLTPSQIRLFTDFLIDCERQGIKFHQMNRHSEYQATNCPALNDSDWSTLQTIFRNRASLPPTKDLPKSIKTHTVVRGDTLTSIGRIYGMSVPELMANNPQIRNANQISIGQIININKVETKNVINVGDTVGILRQYDSRGTRLSNWVMRSVFYVQSIRSSDNTAVITKTHKNPSATPIARMNLDDIRRL
jgi:LysM repeat protein